jgi:hypothetical protein
MLSKMISFTSVVAISLIACGGSNNNKTPDAKGSGSNGSGSGCPLAASYSPGFTQPEADHYAAGTFGSGSPEEVDFFGFLDAGKTQQVDLFINPGSDFPTFPTVSAPKTVTLPSAAKDADVVIFADPDAKGNPQVIYLPVSGSVTITSSGSANATFAGSASNLMLVHADIGSNGATEDPDHCMTTMSFTFTETELVGSAGFQGESPVVSASGLHLQHRFH